MTGMDDKDKIFNSALLFDGFDAKIPDDVQKDLSDFVKQPQPIQTFRSKFVNPKAGGKRANFCETLKTRNWTEQDEGILRLSFWANHMANLKEAKLQDALTSNKDIESHLASPECRNSLDKLFSLRYMAINAKFRCVSYWTLTYIQF